MVPYPSLRERQRPESRSWSLYINTIWNLNIRVFIKFSEKSVFIETEVSNLLTMCLNLQVPPGTPVVNALAKQRAMLENIMRACIGLAPDNNMMLEYK